MNSTSQGSPENGPSAEEFPTRFRDFYPLYLRGHQDPWNRAIHFAGVAAVITAGILAIRWGNPWLFPLVVAATYAVLWTSHVLIEKNVPVTLHGGWRPVVLSILGEFYMTWRFLTGRLGRDLKKFGIRR